MSGYILLFRSILEWKWYRISSVFHILVHLILKANFKDTEWRDITIRRGQLVTSRHSICQETGLTDKVVRGALKKLQKTGEIIIEATNNYSIITICNYDRYQCVNNTNDQKGAYIGLTGSQRMTTIEKRKEAKNNDDSSLRSESTSTKPTTGSVLDVDPTAFLNFFNHAVKEHHSQIPPIALITPRRLSTLNSRAKEHGKEALRKVVLNAVTAPFLNGASEKPFVASFDWLFKPNNFIKVLEGNYNHDINNTNFDNHGTNDNGNSRPAAKPTMQQRIREELEEAQKYFDSIDETGGAGVPGSVQKKIW